MYGHAVSPRVGFATLIVRFMPRVTSYAWGTDVSCAVPVGNLSWMLFQEGRSLNIRLRRGVGQAAHARN